MSLGPFMVDIAGTDLTSEDVRVLSHPMVGSVILFSRNYRDPKQLAELTAAIRAIRSPHLLISVDHEGGRVQRFREGFTRLPASRLLADADSVTIAYQQRADEAAFPVFFVQASNTGAGKVSPADTASRNEDRSAPLSIAAIIAR